MLTVSHLLMRNKAITTILVRLTAPLIFILEMLFQIQFTERKGNEFSERNDILK